MGQCPMTASSSEVKCTAQHEQNLHLSKDPIHCQVIHTSSDFISLPHWCFRSPNVTSSMAELIRASWSAAIDDNRSAPMILTKEEDTDDVIAEVVLSKRPSMSNGHGKADEKRTSASIGERKRVTTVSKYESPVGESADPPNAIHTTPPKQLHRLTPSAVVPAISKSRRVVFYESLLKQWSMYDMNFGVVFKNMKDTVDVVSRMMSFLVNNCDRLDDPNLCALIRKIAMAHNRANVPVESYDALASSTMIAMKKLLGNEYTFEIREAWMMLFSKFFHLVFPLIKAPETIKIRCNTERGL